MLSYKSHDLIMLNKTKTTCNFVKNKKAVAFSMQQFEFQVNFIR